MQIKILVYLGNQFHIRATSDLKLLLSEFIVFRDEDKKIIFCDLDLGNDKISFSYSLELVHLKS